MKTKGTNSPHCVKIEFAFSLGLQVNDKLCFPLKIESVPLSFQIQSGNHQIVQVLGNENAVEFPAMPSFSKIARWKIN